MKHQLLRSNREERRSNQKLFGKRIFFFFTIFYYLGRIALALDLWGPRLLKAQEAKSSFKKECSFEHVLELKLRQLINVVIPSGAQSWDGRGED